MFSKGQESSQCHDLESYQGQEEPLERVNIQAHSRFLATRVSTAWHIYQPIHESSSDISCDIALPGV